MFPSVRLASEVESARTSERRFWVTDKGCSAAFQLRLERTSRFCGAALSAGWLWALESRDKELSDRVR